jgi:hypothetical protein
MKIGIIGAGSIGGNLGRGWAKAGHEIRFGVRKPEAAAELVAECGERAQATDVQTAAAFAEVVVVSTPYNALPEVVSSLGDLEGKVIVDATNPVAWDKGPTHGSSTSAAEEIAAAAPGARVVKAFNTFGAEHLLDPKFGDRTLDVYIAGDDADAKASVAALVEALGLVPVDAGPLRNARLVEHLAVLWIHLATQGGLGRDIGFSLLRK